MRTLTKLVVLIFTVILLTGCSAKKANQDTMETPDAVSSASVVDDADVFTKAISKDGTWIIAITKDLTIDEDLLEDGEFENGKKDDKGNEIMYNYDRIVITRPSCVYHN